MTLAEIAYDLASYAACPLYLPIASRGILTISCREPSGRASTADEIADLCEATGSPVAVLIIPPVRRLKQLQLFEEAA